LFEHKTEHRQAQDLGPVPTLDKLPNAFAGYVASKKAAFFKTNQFIEENKPHFEIINIFPSVILGRNELSTERSDFASGTNRYVMNTVLGQDAQAPMPGATVFVNDCAEVHVLALDGKVRGNQNFIASGGPAVWSDVNEIVENEFGMKAKEGGLKLGGKIDTKPLDLDARETEKMFGAEWVSFEDQVKSVVGHYLTVVKDKQQI
jgi:nucleoside-diphosphate-sugar epimerase